jgi:hypothetical protein
MSRRLAGAVVALMFAGSAGTGLLALRNTPQAPDAAKKSPEAAAAEALDSGLKRLARKEYEAARKDFDAAKQAYMHLFVHDRTASHVLMKTMKAWVAKHRALPAGVDPSAIDAFDAWVRERDTLAMSVGNLGHNSPDWK